MQKWYQIFHKSTGLSPYFWVVLCILPFYFIFRSSSTYEVVYGLLMIILFFACYVLSFLSKGWKLYFWTSMQIVLSIAMTLLFSYAYFSIFLALFIGHVQNRIGFFTLYAVHLATTFITINYGFVTSDPLFISQFPFVLVCLIVVILLPITTYNRNRQGRLQGQLEDANKRISDLVAMQERQRIARDLHDTLGQKLSLIGLKSDLAGRLIATNPDKAQAEIKDVRQTARAALKEVRELVTQMRGTRVEDEMFRVMQILKAADIEFRLEGDAKLDNASLLVENVLSMCLKEAVTNVVKHSRATECLVAVEPARGELVIRVQDNGIGIPISVRGNGLRGMKERLEFVNGSLDIQSRDGAGTALLMKVPIPIVQPVKEAEA